MAIFVLIFPHTITKVTKNKAEKPKLLKRYCRTLNFVNQIFNLKNLDKLNKQAAASQIELDLKISLLIKATASNPKYIHSNFPENDS